MLVSRNVFHVVSALQSIVCLYTFFWLIRSLVDPTLAAFIVCGPLQFVVSPIFSRSPLHPLPSQVSCFGLARHAGLQVKKKMAGISSIV